MKKFENVSYTYIICMCASIYYIDKKCLLLVSECFLQNLHSTKLQYDALLLIVSRISCIRSDAWVTNKWQQTTSRFTRLAMTMTMTMYIYMYIYPWVANYRSNLSAGETSTTGFCVGDMLGNVDYLQTLKAPLREWIARRMNCRDAW